MSHELNTEEDKKIAKEVVGMNNKQTMEDRFGEIWEDLPSFTSEEQRKIIKIFIASEMHLLLQEILEKKLGGISLHKPCVSVEDILSIMKSRGIDL